MTPALATAPATPKLYTFYTMLPDGGSFRLKPGALAVFTKTDMKRYVDDTGKTHRAGPYDKVYPVTH